MTLTAEDRLKLLKQAWDLRKAHEYAAVAELLARLEPAELQAEPELGYLQAESLYYQGEWERSLTSIQHVLEPVRRRGDAVLYLRCRDMEGLVFLATARLVEAESRFLAVLDSAQKQNIEGSVADACTRLGIIADIRGEWDRALSNYRLALTILQRIGRAVAVGSVHHNLGMTYRQTGDLKRSEGHFAKAAYIFHHEKMHPLLAGCEMERALLLNQAGDTRLAGVMAARAQQRFLELGHKAGQADSLRVRGIIAVTQGKLVEARRFFEIGLREMEASSDDLTRAELLEEMALLDYKEGRYDGSVRWTEESTALYQQMGATARVERLRRRFRDVGVGG